MERLLAVRARRDGTMICRLRRPSALVADPARAISTRDVWKNQFESWAGRSIQTARSEAATHFVPLAAAFEKARRKSLQSEQGSLEQWLKERARELEPPVQAARIHLFDTAPTSPAPASGQQTDPVRRLEALEKDEDQPWPAAPKPDHADPLRGARRRPRRPHRAGRSRDHPHWDVDARSGRSSWHLTSDPTACSSPCLPDPFVELELENELNKLHLLPPPPPGRPRSPGIVGHLPPENPGHWKWQREHPRWEPDSGASRDRLGYAKLSSVGRCRRARNPGTVKREHALRLR